MGSLQEKVAWITGAGSGIGQAGALALASAGAKVILSGRTVAPLEETAARIRNDSGEAGVEPLDVCDAGAVKSVADTIQREYGRLDILVNSAVRDPKFDLQHGGHTNSFEDYPLTAWNQALNVNLTGMFLTCQAAVRPMLEQGKGVIINLSSIYGLTGPDQRMYHQEGKQPQYKPVYYSVTKAGVIGLTRYLAAYYAGKNIRVNTLTPGGVYNDHDEEFVKAYSARAVLGRMAQKGDMNGALLFLASDASAYMTGANLVVDGGWTTW